MKENTYSQELIRQLLTFQKDEITSEVIYRRLSDVEKDNENKDVLLNIAADERRHYLALREYTGVDIGPSSLQVFFYVWLARLLGLTFATRQLERNEKDVSEVYLRYSNLENFADMARDEEKHEQQLIGLINEERLNYMGSVVLGLNDALVEFTGALAGFTLALNDTKLIALTGSITGVAAALSMASSEYLSTKSDKDPSKHPSRAALYTGIAYIITVVALVMPFVLLTNTLMALGLMLFMALLIIAFFNYYYAVARNESFKRRFTEMAILSFSVAALSFLIGYLLKIVAGVTT